MAQETTKKKKYLHIEVMRIVAIFAVIFNHTSKDGFLLFTERPLGSPTYWIYLLCSIFCKFAVPLFFAISGAMMLGRPDEPLKKTWSQRILKIAVILAVYSLAYYVADVVKAGGSFSLKAFLIELYSKNVKDHLWYLYNYIAYLAVLPFLKSLVKDLKDKYFYYMMAIVVLFDGILPSLEYLLSQGAVSVNNNIRVTWLMSNIVLFPCLGYFLQNRLSLEQVRRLLPWAWLANVAGLALSCYMTFFQMRAEGLATNVQAYHKCFDELNCAAIFLTIRFLFEERQFREPARRLITSLGKCTFGIYLWHIFYKNIDFLVKIAPNLRAAGVNAMVAAWIMCLAVMAVFYLVTLLQSKIPILKKLVGF